jgi:copper chaperone
MDKSRNSSGEDITYGQITVNSLNDMGTEKTSFKIIGMYCVTCKPIVEKQLKNKNGVKSINIDYMTDSVIIEFDPSVMTKEEIKNRLDKSGYKFVRVAYRHF